MGKKRVHELAKELGLDNNEVISALQNAGIAVKSHSSSVYEEEALAVLNKMKGPAAQEPASPARRPGMMIVKKKKADDLPESEAASMSHDSVEYHEEPAYAEPEHHEERVEAPVFEHVAEVSEKFAPIEASPVAPPPAPPVVSAPVDESPVRESVSERASEPAPVVSVDLEAPIAPATKSVEASSAPISSQTPQSSAVSKPAHSPTTSQPAKPAARPPVQSSGYTQGHNQGQRRPEGGQQPRPQSEQRPGGNRPQDNGQRRPDGQRPQQQDGRGRPDYQSRPSSHAPQSRAPQSGQPNQPQNPAGAAPTGNQPIVTQANRPTRPTTTTTAATVVRMIDRDKLMERVPGRRLGGGPGGPSGDRRPGGPGTGERRYGPGQGGAGADRPRSSTYRPHNPGGGPVQGAGAPGQRFGQVTELRVVTDPFGRGREMVQVGRDKKKAAPGAGAGAGAPGAKGAPAKKGRGPSKREMVEMRERSVHPSRIKRKKVGKSLAKRPEGTMPKASKRVIKMKQTIQVSELAHELGVKSVDIIRKLMALGMMVTQNQSIDFDTAQIIATEYEYTVESVAFAEAEVLKATPTEEATENLLPRPPVVTVMGHVDHGKTSLLDAIRKARVAAGEAGGITQHIGAYSVSVPGKGTVTFLDTPGHAAFTQMRARGAQVTDLVILVVAADDGVMPQTEEAIKHAQAAKVPIIVAVNKIDKPDAQPDRVMQELTKYNLLSEAWGGDTMFVNTSATKGTGITELLEGVLLQADVLELKANPNRPAVGVVLEAKLDKGRGPVATVLVQKGTLKRGDDLVVGEFAGRIRAMSDDQGQQLKEAGPSAAVEIIGLDGVPEAGDKLNVVENAEKARQVATHRQDAKRALEQTAPAAMSLDDMMKRMAGAGDLELKIVLKGDVQGSIEAVKQALLKLSNDEVKVNVVYAGVGAISESDIMLAAASRGVVVGFSVRPDANARSIAEKEGVEIRIYNIIYEVVDDMRKAMEGLLSPVSREKILGRAEVREMFRITKVGVIAGCRVTEGKALRSAKVRVLRDSVQIYDGKVSSLRHFKSDVREVDTGLECGIGVEGFNDIKLGDAIEFYQVEEVARTFSGPSNNPPTRRSGGSVAAQI